MKVVKQFSYGCLSASTKTKKVKILETAISKDNELRIHISVTRK